MWSPHSDCSSVERDLPSSSVTQNWADRSPAKLSGSQLVPSTSPTNRGGWGGVGFPMAAYCAGRRASVGQRRHWLPLGLCLGENGFHEPIRGNLTKLERPVLASKGTGLGFSTFFVFWSNGMTVSYF